MAKNINKHGLSRDIPSPTKRAVRRECGFGCVICGCCIYQYEHIEPEWRDAKAHAVSAIALLCGRCHDLVTRGFVQKQEIAEARLHPYCMEHGYGAVSLSGPRSDQRFCVSLGGCTFVNPRCILRVFSTDLLSIREPEVDSGPVRISAAFFNTRGQSILEIVENEYRVRSTNWDVEAVGGLFVVNDPTTEVLRLEIKEPQHIRVTRMQMTYNGATIMCDANVSSPHSWCHGDS